MRLPVLAVALFALPAAPAIAADCETPPILEAKDFFLAVLLKGEQNEVEPR